MSLYFFHLRDGSDILLDPDGAEMAFAEVAAKALWQARDCMAGDVKGGCVDLRFHIDVHDESGANVHSIAFADAVEIIPAA
jgi:Domain of unknown function (DUF6894)